MSKETTNIQEVDVDLNDVLGTGVEAVMTPNEESSKNSIFSRGTPDTTFLDKPVEKETEEPEDSEKTTEEDPKPAEEPVDESIEKPAEDPNPSLDDVLQVPSLVEEEETEEKKNKGGRPTNAVSAIKTLIDEGKLLPFDEDKKLEEYNAEDIKELIELNIQQVESKLAKEVPQHFYEQLPDEMKDAYEYLANGGKDIKAMFKALADTTEIKDLNPDVDKDAKNIIRTYLSSTKYGTPEEIEDEILDLEDRGTLEKKANQFKPKLDMMQQELVNQKIAEQQSQLKQRQAQSQMYMENVYTTLEKGDLNGIELDNKTQEMLYSGLVQANYPASNGGQTNMLGHLLEKYQFKEPRHDLIAETLWLLADPDGYKDNIRRNVEKEVTEKTVRTLKTEQSSKSSSSQPEEPVESKPVKRKTIKRNSGGFFKR